MDDLLRADIADELEAVGSQLCDCQEYGAPVGNAGQPIAHHCECRAVRASIVIRNRMSITRHERECSPHPWMHES